MTLSPVSTLKSSKTGNSDSKASEKVMQYYTPRSLRKVLEYVSIDYTGLDLKIPDWAEEMLREDQD